MREDVVVARDIAHVADEAGGLALIDISNPVNPGQIGSLKTSGFAASLAVWRDRAYLGGSSGVEVIDISVPGTPQSAGFLATLPASALVVSSGKLCAAVDADGLAVFDLPSEDLTFAGIGVSEDGFRFQLRGPAGLNARVQRSDSLRDWNDWLQQTLPEASAELIDSQSPPSGKYFYRAVAP